MIERMLDHISWAKESEMGSVELLIVGSVSSKFSCPNVKVTLAAFSWCVCFICVFLFILVNNLHHEGHLNMKNI